MNAFTTAAAGIQAASSRLANAANNIANMNTPGFRAQEPAQADTPAGVQVRFSPTTTSASNETSNVDLPNQMVELITARHSVALNTAVIHSQDSMTQSLLDILA